MYRKELVDIPNEGKGKISKKNMKNYVQVMYVIDGGYNPETKICSPKRTIIGKAETLESNRMFPNENYYKIFGSKLNLSTPFIFTNRSGVLKIGTCCVIEKIMTECNLHKILSKVIIDSHNYDLSGLFKDLIIHFIINEKNVDIMYSDYAFNHPLFSKNMHIYSEYTIKYFLTILSPDIYLDFINQCKNNKDTSEKLFNQEASYIESILGAKKLHGESFIKFLASYVRNRMNYLIRIHTIKNQSDNIYYNLSRVISELEKIELVRQADGIYVFGNPLTQYQRNLLAIFCINDSYIVSFGNKISRNLRRGL